LPRSRSAPLGITGSRNTKQSHGHYRRIAPSRRVPMAHTQMLIAALASAVPHTSAIVLFSGAARNLRLNPCLPRQGRVQTVKTCIQNRFSRRHPAELAKLRRGSPRLNAENRQACALSLRRIVHAPAFSREVRAALGLTMQDMLMMWTLRPDNTFLQNYHFRRELW